MRRRNPETPAPPTDFSDTARNRTSSTLYGSSDCSDSASLGRFLFCSFLVMVRILGLAILMETDTDGDRLEFFWSMILLDGVMLPRNLGVMQTIIDFIGLSQFTFVFSINMM